MKKLFTSEAVTEGHPDKLCDRISDAVLDAVLAKDPAGRVACECFATTGLVVVGGRSPPTAPWTSRRSPATQSVKWVTTARRPALTGTPALC